MRLENLAKLRKEKNLNQSELAQIFNVNQNTVSRWEKGTREPDMGTLIELAKYFDVSVDFLLGNTIVRTPIATTAAHMYDSNYEYTPEEELEIKNFMEYMRSKAEKKRSNKDK